MRGTGVVTATLDLGSVACTMYMIFVAEWGWAWGESGLKTAFNSQIFSVYGDVCRSIDVVS